MHTSPRINYIESFFFFFSLFPRTKTSNKSYNTQTRHLFLVLILLRWIQDDEKKIPIFNQNRTEQKYTQKKKGWTGLFLIYFFLVLRKKKKKIKTQKSHFTIFSYYPSSSSFSSSSRSSYFFSFSRSCYLIFFFFFLITFH